MTARRVGGYEFNYQCARIRSAAGELNQSLKKVIESNPGPQTMAMLMARMALEVAAIGEAINNLERIGTTEKSQRK